MAKRDPATQPLFIAQACGIHMLPPMLLVLLGVDQVLDMGLCASNVFGNSLAASVSRWGRVLTGGGGGE